MLLLLLLILVCPNSAGVCVCARVYMCVCTCVCVMCISQQRVLSAYIMSWVLIYLLEHASSFHTEEMGQVLQGVCRVNRMSNVRKIYPTVFPGSLDEVQDSGLGHFFSSLVLAMIFTRKLR